MSYGIRFFTTVPLSTLIPLQAQMIQRGFQVNPVGTNQLDIYYARDRQQIQVDLTDSTQDSTRTELTDFLHRVGQLASSEVQGFVLDTLSRTQALVLIVVPDDYDDDHDALNHVIDIVTNSAEGIFHVGGEGFYEGDSFILELP